MLRAAGSGTPLRAVATALVAAPDNLHAAVDAAMAATGLGRGKVMKPLRAALTGATSGIELDRLVPLLARGHALFGPRVTTAGQRIERALRTAEGSP